MADARVRRHDLERVERALAPAQERVALAVAAELELGVAADREPAREVVDLHRVVDHELGRDQRVDPAGSPPKRRHRLAHRGQVDDGRDAGEVLEEDARRREGDLARRLGLAFQVATASTSAAVTVDAVLAAQDVLEQDPQRVRQARDVEAALRARRAGTPRGRAARRERASGRRRCRDASCGPLLSRRIVSFNRTVRLFKGYKIGQSPSIAPEGRADPLGAREDEPGEPRLVGRDRSAASGTLQRRPPRATIPPAPKTGAAMPTPPSRRSSWLERIAASRTSASTVSSSSACVIVCSVAGASFVRSTIAASLVLGEERHHRAAARARVQVAPFVRASRRSGTVRRSRRRRARTSAA